MFYHLSDKDRYEPLPLEDGIIFRSQEIPGFWPRVDWLWQTPLPNTFDALQELMPELQTEALRQAEMKIRDEANARRREANAQRQAEAELDRLRVEFEALRGRSEEEEH